MASYLAQCAAVFCLLVQCVMCSAASQALERDSLAGDAALSPAGSAVLEKVMSAFAQGGQIDIRDISMNTSAWSSSFGSEDMRGLNLHSTRTGTGRHTDIQAILAGALIEGLRFPADGLRGFIDPELQEWKSSFESDSDSEAGLTVKEVPGVVAVVYQDFFTKASAVAIKLLEENFQKVKLDSVRAIAKVPVLGDFDIKLENVQLEGLQLDKTSTGVVLGDEGGFDLDVTDLDAVVSGHFQWRRTRFPFISGGCQAQVTAVKGNVKLRVAVVGDESGRPKIADMDAAHLSFDSLSIVTSGAKLSWLYNAVAAFAHTQIQDAITRAVGKQVSTTVPGKVNELLQGVPVIVHIKDLDLNTSLAKDPQVTPDRLVIWDWGRFQNPNHILQACPFVRRVDLSAADKPILPGGSPYQVVADIDESIVNCLTWDMFHTGKLHAFLQGDDLPEKALYTDSWRFVIPAVWLRCPGCPMAVNATVTSAPKTQIRQSGGIVSQGTAELSFFLAEDQSGGGVPWTPIRNPSGDSTASSASERRLLAETPVDNVVPLSHGKGKVGESKQVLKSVLDEEESERGLHSKGSSLELGEHLFTLSLSGELSVQNLTLDPDSVSDGWRLNLRMKINHKALKVGVVESDVGDINEAALHFALTVASFLVEDKVNHGILADGFPLPDIPHIKVERANVTVVDYALAIGADFSYLK